MIVDIINGNGLGWGTYVLGRYRERNEAYTVLGDTLLGDMICKSADHYLSGNAVKMVVSFGDQDNVSSEEGRVIVKEFVDKFMHGFRADEYHTDIVEHTDTEHLHYHIRIPKLNLLTGTQLKPYYHKSDLSYKKALIDYISDKYDLVTGEANKKLIVDPYRKVDQIDRWRTQYGQEPFNLSTKSGRGEAEERLYDYFIEMNLNGFIDSLDDIVGELVSIGFEIVKIDRDRGKEFDYITVQNDTGKIRLKGDIYGQQFYGHSREDRSKAIKGNQSLDKGSRSDGQSRNNIEQTLQRESEKRLKWIDRQYGSARKRALQRIQKIERQLTSKFDKNEKDAPGLSSPYCSTDRRNYRNIGNSLLKKVHRKSDPSLYLQTKGQITSVNGERLPNDILYDQAEQKRFYFDKEGEISDRNRREAIERVIVIRKAKRTRTEVLRKKLDDDIEKLDGKIPRVDERDLQASKTRTAALNSLIKRVGETTERNYRALDEATSSAANTRAVGEDFDAIIPRIRAGINQVFERVKQEFDRRTKNFVIGIANVIRNKQLLYENENEKDVSNLRQEKVNFIATSYNEELKNGMSP